MFGFQGMGGLFHDLPPFNKMLRAYPTAMLNNRPDVNKGGKIILPPSALDYLTRLHIEYPMLFKLTNVDPKKQRVSHCGVLEFVAEEGKCYLPYWMMQNLYLEPGDMVQIQNVSLPAGKFVKFQWQNAEFMNITNPRAVLEVYLRNFATLTKGDVIAIDYNDTIHQLLVRETKPGNAISIIECDVNVEFEAPEGYVEPQRIPKPVEEPMEAMPRVPSSAGPIFPGAGQRVDGRAAKTAEPEANGIIGPRGVPNYGFKPGKLKFLRMPKMQQATDADAAEFQPFSGVGQKMKDKKR